MIVKMKKLTLLSMASQQEETLEKLRELEVVHVEHVQKPEGEAIDAARQQLQTVHQAKDVLAAQKNEAKVDAPAKGDLVATVLELLNREKELKDQIQNLEHEHHRIAPFGDFDPTSIQQLIENGLFIKLYEVSKKAEPEVPEGVAIETIGENKHNRYILAVSQIDFSLSSTEVALPEQSLSEVEQALESTKEALKKSEEELATQAVHLKQIEKIAEEHSDALTYLEVQHGMGAEEVIVYLKGFYPAEREEDLIAAAQKNGWGYQLEEVADDDNPPTLLRNPKWVSPVKAVFQMIGVVPGYKELDVSALFLIFLSIFFAFIIGDAGYGLLFVALTLFGKMKSKGNKSAQIPLNLMLLMSAFCVVFGALTGNYFGIPIESLPAPLKMLTNSYMTGWNGSAWDTDLAANHIMFICFSIALVHLSIAHIWNIIRKINSPAALVDLGWLFCTWSLFTVVLNMVLYITLPALVQTIQLPLLGAGVLSIIIGLVLTKSYFGLVTLFLDVISNFVDIISYVRLYAVGAASLAIAQAFNGMAADIGFSGIGALGAAAILFAGHGLNIILGAMGVMVHGIRLNTLEFSSHAGVEWAGSPFNPFRKHKDEL